MPSGVSQGAALGSGLLATAVPFSSTREKSGMRLMSLPHRHLVSVEHIMCRLQRRQRVAAWVNEGLYAGVTQRTFLISWSAGEINMFGAGVFQGLRGCGGAAGINLIGGAQADEGRRGDFERRGHLVGCARAFDGDSFNSASFEEVSGECRARGEIGRRTECGQEDFRPRASLSENAVGGVAQLLERLRKAHRTQRYCFQQ